MLKITRRAAKVGPSINTRTEKHGEDDVTALDIPLREIVLAPAGLEELMPGAGERLFDDAHEPVFGRWKALTLREKIESANVTLWLGLAPTELAFTDVKLSRVTVTPTSGGGATLQCTVQVTPDLDESIAQLLEHLNRQVEVELVCENFGSQGELDLGGADSDEELDDAA